MVGSPYENDIGTEIIFTIKDRETGDIVDLSAVTDVVYTFIKPDSSRIQRTGAIYTNGTDGKLVYTTVDGDLDQTGNWQVQVTFTDPSGTWSASVERFKVLDQI